MDSKMTVLEEIKLRVEQKKKERDIFQFHCFNLKQRPQSEKNLCWRVFTVDMNSNEILAMNLFDLNYEFNGKLYEITKVIQDYAEWEKELNSALHTFWSRFQYEICISDLFENSNNSKKIDVYTQITMNWNHFTEYLWNNKNLILNELKGNYDSYKEYIDNKRQAFKEYLKQKRG